MTHHINLDTITLAKGGHSGPDDGFCVMEAVSYFAGLPFSDQPECVSTVLINFGISLNDRLPDNLRQQLVPLIPTLVGTRGDGQDEARSYLALDWLIRTWTPTWLDLAGLTAEATALRDLRRLVDRVSAQAAGPVVRAGRDKAAAAWDAAWDAAGAAAWDAAGAAAWDAAGAAARAAAWAAAWDAAWAAAGAAAGDAAWNAAWNAAWAAAGAAAWDAAGAAAWAAAGKKLAPTVELLQQSAIDLFTRMINPGAEG